MPEEEQKPESVQLPEPKKRGVKGIRTTIKPLPYDSTHCYIQMGSAVQSSMEARKAFRRIAILLDDVQESRSRHANAVIERIQDLLDQFSDLEIMILKLEKAKQQEATAILSRAFGELRTALGWYQKMLEAHKDEDQTALAPLLEQLKAVVAGLGDVRQQKVTAALAMEERFSKSRRDYWNERRSSHNLLKPVKKSKKKDANATEPVEREYMPYPVNSVEPEVALNPKELIKQASEQIRARDQLKKLDRDKKLAEQDYGTEPSEE